MAKIEGLPKLKAKLKALAEEAKSDYDVSTTVGFEAHYALYVHEDLEAHHDVGQAKFLEQPFRENAKEYYAIVASLMKTGTDFRQACYIAGLRLQRDAMQLCPIDTGNLRASAFTRQE